MLTSLQPPWFNLANTAKAQTDSTSTVSIDPPDVTDLTLTPESPLVLRPDGDGTYLLDWYGSYMDWDEADPHDGDGTYQWVDWGPMAIETSTLQDPPGPPGWTIAAVRVHIVAKSTAYDPTLGANQIYIILYHPDWAWEDWGKKFELTTTYQHYTSEWAKNPVTGDFWTWTDILNLEAGVMSGDLPSGGEIRVTQLYVEILGPRLALNINVDYVENLQLYQFELLYNPDLLQGIYIHEGNGDPAEIGPFLTSTGLIAYPIRGTWKNDIGRLTLTGAYVEETDPALLPDGGGTLATVVFWIIRKGEADITLGPRTQLYGPSALYPPYGEIPTATQPGYFRNTDLASLPTATFQIIPDVDPEHETLYGEIVPLQGYNTTFDASASTAAPGRTITTYKWYFWRIYREELFWPIQTLTTTTTVKNYTSTGTYNITFTVIDDQNTIATEETTITIKSHDIFFLGIVTNTLRAKHPLVNYTDIGTTVEVNVTVINEGDYPETFNVSTFWRIYPGTPNEQVQIIGTQYDISLAAGANTTLTFYWDTTGLNLTHPDTYRLSANASKLKYEWDTEMVAGKITPNQFTDGDIRIRHHDIAITDLTLNATTVWPGNITQIDVTVQNHGDFNETSIDVTTYYDDTPIETQTINLLTNKTYGKPPRFPQDNWTITLTYYWDTTGVPDGQYTIKAAAATVPNEYDPYDNVYGKEIRVCSGPCHDITVESVTALPSRPFIGDDVDITVSVSNKGNVQETFELQVFYNASLIDTQMVTLDVGATDTVTFTWHTAGLSPGNYNVTATAVVSEDLTPADNTNFVIVSLTQLIIDVAVEDLRVSEERVLVGDSVEIKVDVANKGNRAESFDLQVSYDANLIDSRRVSLSAGASRTETFTWDTSGVSPGTYTITAEAVLQTDQTQDNNILSLTVLVMKAPVAGFTYSPEEPIAGQPVMFNSTSYDEDGSIVRWEWDLNGDGVVDVTNETASWTYTAPGDYWVTLNVTDNHGNWDIYQETVRVSPMIHDVAVESVTASPSEVTVGGVVTIVVNVTNNGNVDESFNLQVSYDATQIESRSVTLTVGASGTLTFTWDTSGVSPGTYTITAEAAVPDDQNQADNTNSTTVKVNPKPQPPQPPTAAFTYSPSKPLVGQTVLFNASASYDPDGTIVSYSWDFGDGTTGSGKTVTHKYAKAGKYTVKLTVTDDDGQTSDPVSKLITVEAPPEAFPMWIIFAVAVGLVIVLAVVFFIRRKG
jgi:PKD repeat protein